MKRTRLVVLVLLVTASLPLFARSTPVPPAFVTFGDSLADNGNDLVLTRLLGENPATPPSVSPYRTYYNGRFSNGPVAFEYLWSMLNGRPIGSLGALRPFMAFPILGRTDAANFAFGGSRTGFFEPVPGSTTPVPGLRAQIQMYGVALAGRKPVPGTLYGIATGANNYLVLPPETPAAPSAVVANIARGIKDLYGFGARTVVLLNLPDLGQIPLIQDPAAAAGLSQLSQLHNVLLSSAAADLRVQLPELTLIVVDLNQVLQNLPATTSRTVPALEVLLPMQGASTCLFTNPATCRDVPTFNTGLQFLFWDAEHPTTAVHQRLAQYIYGLLGS